MKIVVWAAEVTPYTIDPFIELQKITNGPILYLTWQITSKWRKDHGWEDYANTGELTVIEFDHKKWWSQGINIINLYKDAVHIFVGFWSVRYYFLFILFGLLKHIKIAIMNEPFSSGYFGYGDDDLFIINWIKVKLRPILYHLAAFFINLFSDDTPPVLLPISLLAKEQLIRNGFKRDSIFPFGWFINKEDKINHLDNTFSKDGELKISYLGSLIRRKGLTVAMEAMEILKNKRVNVKFDIYGPGRIEDYQLCKYQKVNYLGVLPREKSQSTIAQYDLLLLPSFHDGWGVVVNEAILQGVPAIVSDTVGSKCILEKSGAGLIFRSGDSLQLADIIEQLYTDPNKLLCLKNKCKSTAEKILPSVAANYLFKVFNFYFYHMRRSEIPDAIWC